MNEDRKLTIYFNNGTQMNVSFPVQIKNSTAAVLEAMKKMGQSDKLAIEAEERLIVIPWSSVQHIELAPIPAAVPFGAIKAARIIQ